MEYIVAGKQNMDLLMHSRLEMLREVNDLPPDYIFSDDFIENTEKFFEAADQTTILAVDNAVVGCATLCYMELMPTFSHPTGKRAHLMNVYTNSRYRRQGIAQKMLHMLINKAKQKGVTEISLDTTESGRPLYKRMGFEESEECMVLNL